VAETFEDVWRRVRLYVPNAPVLLVRAWVQDAYAQVFDYRGWAFSILENQLVWDDLRTVTVNATFNSLTITAAAATFLPADAGRQFSVGTWPKYTIQSVTLAGDQITLDQPYVGTETGAVTAQILDAYATLPPDFGRFSMVTDQVNQRCVPWWCTQEELNLLDPTRTALDSVPRLLGARKLSPFPGTLGQVQYEYWPTPTAAGSLQYYAIGRPTRLADEFVFRGVLGDRTDVIESGALASAAKWPGPSKADPNPYFNIALARELKADFEAGILQLDIRDDDVYQQSISNIPWQRWSAWTWAYDTRLLRETDATLGSYFGYTNF